MAVLKLVANFSLWQKGKSTLGVFPCNQICLLTAKLWNLEVVWLVILPSKLTKHFGKVDLANRKHHHGKTTKSEKST
jgi:hypothetical protein